MKIISAARELGHGNRKVCLAIGVFDGIHLGHQQIIRQTIADARLHDALAVVITFDRHPNSVVAPDRVPQWIYAPSQKIEAIKSLGTDAMWEIHFDREFSQLSGEVFISELVRDFGKIQSICVGADFVFGHRRSGNVALLKKLAPELGFQVHGLAAVSLDGHAVSSTRIREAIRAGNFDAAGQMLGRPYAICGKVVAGDRVGRQLGFPTANLDVIGMTLPPNGVYAAATLISGQFYQAALNIGLRPTLNSPVPQLRVEAHLLDFEGDLYGSEIEIEPGQKLRDERKFGSRDELRHQIGLDVAAVRSLL
ncbi:MAG TPA: bifunctional riboflavin kinase/FAD synthetase [Candidatus Acidoferrum sp.]|nr:bifunctional riboflavin kinase/FAD synthetase [Candidatus Acidoferrum sp.]